MGTTLVAIEGQGKTDAVVSTPCRVELASGAAALAALAPEWEQRRRLTNGPLGLDPWLVQAWWRHRRPGDEPSALVARSGGVLEGVWPLAVRWTRIDGIPLRLVDTPVDGHALIGGPLLAAEAARVQQVVEAMVDALVRLPVDAFHLGDVPDRGNVQTWAWNAFVSQGMRVWTESPRLSPWMPLPPSIEVMDAQLDGHFRQNLRRRARRLEARGPVRLETLTTSAGLDAALEDVWAIESDGWKGRARTSIREDASALGLYAAWAHHLAQTRRLRLHFLRCGDERIAFHLGVADGGRYHLPKCGFRESWATDSPGQQLVHRVAAASIAEGLTAFEFHGHSMPWKRDWTPLHHPHAHLWVVRSRSPAGAALWAMRRVARPWMGMARRSWHEYSEQLSRSGVGSLLRGRRPAREEA